jgi:uncharacterized protein (TIGR00106 family)
MYPLGRGESVGRYVARSLDIVDKSGLPYKLHAMGTVLEGEWDECFQVVKDCFQAMKKECPRVELVLKVDHRAGHSKRLNSKVASLERRLKRSLQK